MVQADQLLKKNFWIAILPLIAITAYLNARAVTQLVGIQLGPDEKALAAPPVVSVGGASASSSASTRTLSAEPILDRNPFDHVTGSLKPPPTVVDETAPAAVVDTSDIWNVPKCDGVKVLVIAASPEDHDWSLATFSGNDGNGIMRRIGGDVNGKTVKFIGWDRVWLESGGALCQANLFDKTATPAPVAAAPPPSPSGGRSSHGVAPDILKGIQKVGPNEFNIDRTVVDKILENQADLMRQARIVPETDASGRTVGIKLLGLKPDSLLGVLGMQNSDRLQTINGFDMANPEKALEAYARLRTADKLTVSLNRNGQNMNLDYNIK